MAGHAVQIAPDSIDLFDDAALSKRAVRNKHVSINQIRIISGRIEADYEVNTAGVNNAGTLRMRIGPKDEAVQKLIAQLGQHVLDVYSQVERA